MQLNSLSLETLRSLMVAQTRKSIKLWFPLFCSFSTILTVTVPAEASTILYDQDFENPTGFINNGGDISIQPVNNLYGNQPPGFVFAEQFGVETLLITGDQAFGTGYSDPLGIGGNYALSMLSDIQDELLGLSFNVGSNNFLNVKLDISSIDLDRLGGPFIPAGGAAPTFEFTLFDNPTGTLGIGNGSILSSQQVSGTLSDRRNVFDWTEALFSLDASDSTNGNVILRIDLLSGHYAAFDNLRVAASNTPVTVPTPATVPEPNSIFSIAFLAFAVLFKKTLGISSPVKHK